MKKTELQTMLVAELKALAKKMKIKLPAGARKTDIIELLASSFKKKRRPADAKKARTTRGSSSAAQKKAPGTKKNVSVEKRIDTEKRIASEQQPVVKPAAAVPKPAAATPPSGLEWKLPPKAEEPIMAQERVSDAKYYTGPEQEQAGFSSGLPLGYGEEKIALLPRDPYIAYAYWETTPSRIAREKAWFGWNGKIAIRIYDVTGVQFDGRNAAGYYDQEVNSLAGSWYFDLGRPSHSFIADIGLLSPEGKFLTLARSNYITMSSDGVSDVVDEEWMLADEEFWKLYGFPGGPSSLQLQEMVRIRRLQRVTSPGERIRISRLGQEASPSSFWGHRLKRK